MNGRRFQGDGIVLREELRVRGGGGGVKGERRERTREGDEIGRGEQDREE